MLLFSLSSDSSSCYNLFGTLQITQCHVKFVVSTLVVKFWVDMYGQVFPIHGALVTDTRDNGLIHSLSWLDSSVAWRARIHTCMSSYTIITYGMTKIHHVFHLPVPCIAYIPSIAIRSQGHDMIRDPSTNTTYISELIMIPHGFTKSYKRTNRSGIGKHIEGCVCMHMRPGLNNRCCSHQINVIPNVYYE